MGGAVALKVHLKQPGEWDGAILVMIADDVIPPWPVQQIMILMATILPKLKLVPQKALAELAFREEKKREQVCLSCNKPSSVIFKLILSLNYNILNIPPIQCIFLSK